MKKVVVTMIGLLVLAFALSGISYAWQGRMGGIGDPYGLVADESDFLIHPAKIAKGEGIRFYGDYRFTYTGVTDWDIDLDLFPFGSVLTYFYHYDTSGQEYKHNALLGAGFPLGPGRMGFFFTYDGMRGDYDGDEDIMGASNFAQYNLSKDLNNFVLQLLYGLPAGGGVDVGIELGVAYRDEREETWLQYAAFGTKNNVLSLDFPMETLLGFMIPYDSNYWELLWKAGMKKELGPLGINVSLKGGYIISSDNSYDFLYAHTNIVDMEGNVAGWRIGSDIWLRYVMGKELTFPFLFSIDYAEKKRDGDGRGTSAADTGRLYDYTHKERSLDLKVGGGVEKRLGHNALIAGGIYYNYLRESNDASFIIHYISPYSSDNSDFPFHQEHRAIMRLVGEMEISPAVTLRIGLVPFFGWVREDFKFTRNFSNTTDITIDGSHWGIWASVGGTIKIPSIHMTLEPFFNGGWQQYNLDGDGHSDRTTPTGTVIDLWGMDKARSEWSVGGGLSVLYDL
jgi:hypothetical protein